MKLIKPIRQLFIKYIVGTALLCSTATPLYARQLSANEAAERIKQVENQLSARLGAPSAKGTTYILRQTVPAADANAYYVFERKKANHTDGFIIATADTRLRPVLAHFASETFNTDSLPENVSWWLDEYQRQIEAIRSQPEAKDTDNTDTATTSRPAIEPLITTRWDQGAPYNDLCPNVNGGKAVTGCVATAFAQIMNYHKWPARGQGEHSYTSGGNSYSIDFSEVEFDWDSMLDVYDDQSSEESRTAVATLMKACGYSVDMNYSTWASGAVTELISSRAPQFFDYSTDCYHIDRFNYSDSEWEDIVYSQLSIGLPLIYNGRDGNWGNSSGHCFICDGYSVDGLFHFNWGWSGAYDGWFALSALSPEGAGIGGSYGGYNFDQGVIVNFKPSTDTRPSISTIYGRDFSVNNTSVSCSVSIANPEFLTQTPTFSLEVIKGDQTIGYLPVGVSGDASTSYLNLNSDLSVDILNSMKLTEGVYALRFAIDLGDGVKPLNFGKYSPSLAILNYDGTQFSISKPETPVEVEFGNVRFNGYSDLVKSGNVKLNYDIVNPTDKNVYMSITHSLYNVETGKSYNIWNANATAVAGVTSTISFDISASRFEDIPDGTYCLSLDEYLPKGTRTLYHDTSRTFRVITPYLTDGTFTYVEDSDNPGSVILVALKDASKKLSGDVVIPGEAEIDGEVRYISSIMAPLSELINRVEVKTLRALGPVRIDDEVLYRSNVKEVEISGRVTQIGSMAFHSCSNIKSFHFTEGNEPLSINQRAFEYADIDSLFIDREIVDSYFYLARPVNVVYGNTVKSIPDNAFYNYNPTVKSVKFGSSIESIGANAFSQCKLKGDLILPPSLVEIGEYAFSISEFENIVLGPNVTKVGRNAFHVGDNLQSITMTSPTPIAFVDLPKGTTLRVLPSAVEAYKQIPNFANCQIEPLVEATGITLTADNVRDTESKEYIYHANIEPADATLKYVFWASPDINLATVDHYGHVTFKTDDHNVLIKAMTLYGGVETDMIPTLNPRCELDNVRLTLNKYDMHTLHAQVVNTHQTEFNFDWTSSNSDIVSVRNDGTVEALKAGESVITVTATSADGITLTDKCTVTVNPTFGFAYPEVVLDIEEVLQLPIVNNDAQTNEVFTYTSSDNAVAYVNMSGLLVGMGIEGRCTVTALRDNESYELEVNVVDQASLIQPIPNGVNFTTDATAKTVTIEYSPDASGEIVIPSNTLIDGEVYTVTEIGYRAFADAKERITSIYLPNTVTSIGKHAFIHCENLTYLHIGSGVTFIGEGALGFAHIDVFECEAITPPRLDIDCMYACWIGTLRVPTGTAEEYRTTSYNQAYGWSGCCGNIVDFDFDTDKAKMPKTKIEPTAIVYESISKTPWMMNVRLEPVGAQTTINWQSSHPEVAVIDHGLITYLQDDAHSSFTATTLQGHVAVSPLMTGVENIATNNVVNNYNVYNLQGICILKNASVDDLKRLPRGLYIYNGKKIYVK